MAVTITEAITVGFIGAGKMAEAIARGVANSGTIPAARMRAADLSEDRRRVFSELGVKAFDSLMSSELICLLHSMLEWVGHGRLIRVMPNTPCLVGKGASVMCLGDMATHEDEKLVSSIFGSVGKIWTADEKLLDGVTGLSGSGPAYIFLAIEAMADGGVAAGVPRELALSLASQTVLGAGALAIEKGDHPGQLKDEVASPAGTTMAGICELEKGAFRGLLISAVTAAAKRSQELSN
ncbi:hypothetical protein EJ110_NYTH30154 [Nymphaea thermarum]|nr:hypothetical protein EJ110_NYTH30154 [Nymphaea thermarum]